MGGKSGNVAAEMGNVNQQRWLITMQIRWVLRILSGDQGGRTADFRIDHQPQPSVTKLQLF